jgi:hypothetical protein
MIRTLAISSGLACVMAMAVVPQGASAATIGPHSKMIAGESLVQQIQGGRYCRFVRRECAERWGWRTRAWYICIQRRGCGRDDDD